MQYGISGYNHYYIVNTIYNDVDLEIFMQSFAVQKLVFFVIAREGLEISKSVRVSFGRFS